MRNKFALSIAAAAIFVFLLYSLVERAPETVAVDDETEVADNDAVRQRAEECGLACERLAICEHTLGGDGCLDLCAATWDGQTVTCIQESACREIDDTCLVEDPGEACDEACEKALECGLVVPGEDCRELCLAEWAPDLRTCLRETACDQIESVCLPAIPPDDCTVFCDRLAVCEMLIEDEQTDCLESCLTVDDPDLRDCVAAVPCELIEPVCLADDYDPLCLAVCNRIGDCGGIEDIDPDYCPAVCMASWDEQTESCLLDSNCEELAPVCLGRPDPECAETCRKLMDCGLEYEYDDCAATCSTSLADAARQCIIEVPCEQIDTVCFGAAPDFCVVVCDKLVNCGLDEDFDVCYEACDAAPDLDLIRCILAYPCEGIVENCS